MSTLVNCFKFWCNVREKGDKRDKPEYKEMKEIKNNLLIRNSMKINKIIKNKIMLNLNKCLNFKK